MNGHFMAFEIELLCKLILIVVCLCEESHFRSAIEMIASLFDSTIFKNTDEERATSII